VSRRLVAALAATALTASCTLGPDYRRPDLDTPEAYRDAVPSPDSLANLPWWEVLHDEALQELVRTALEHNKDLQAAYWRVEAARARLGFTKADLWPTFDYGLRARADNPSNALPPLPGDRQENYFAGVGISWEIDIWGKLRRSNESARANLLATEWGRRAFTVSLVAEVARLYFLLRDFDTRLEISRETLESRTRSTELVRQRFEGGVVSELDVRQAEVQEAIAASAVPAFERAVAQTENALSVILGRAPGPIPRGQSLVDQELPDETPAGLPSDLLQRRPDVLRAEELLHAQMARIGVARALRFPQLNLTGAFGLESNELSEFTSSDAGFWSIGLDLFGPLFQFGKNKRRVDVERYRTEEAVLGYENTILQAFREVEDSLIAIRTLRDEYEARARQVASGHHAARLSRARYDGGVTSYLEVLDTERSLFDSQLEASRTLQEHYNAIVALYAALGGGWDPIEVYIPQPQVPGNEREE
jgi:multidrug efflux system outer membrane protein